MGDMADLLEQYANICNVPVVEVNQQGFLNWLSGADEEETGEFTEGGQIGL